MAKKAAVKTSKRSETSQRVSKSRKTEENEVTSSSILSSLKLSRRNSIIAISILVVLGLGVLASKYLVVAWVDKKPISKFELFSNLESRYGKDATEEMIVEKLILSEARNRNIDATASEVDAEIKKLEEQQGGAEQLNQILEVQGIKRDDFQRLVKLQLLRQKMFGSGVEVTEEEIKQYAEENKDQLGTVDINNTASSESAQLKESIKEQLSQQKINANFNTWLQDALKGSRVVRN